MEISDFKGSDICNIIKTCAKNNVTEFVLGDFAVKFSGSGTDDIITHERVGIPVDSPTPGTVTEPIQPLNISEEDRQEMRELEDHQILMEDPMQWEQTLIDGYLTGEDKHGADEHSRPEQDLPRS